MMLKLRRMLHGAFGVSASDLGSTTEVDFC
jgi:hypothetical protein